MQGHPELPRLWEKHADAILRECGLVPTIHEPCLYSGRINGKRGIFKRQVDDFVVAAPDEHTANILLDMIDDKLTILMKRQGYLDMYNSIDVLQTRIISRYHALLTSIKSVKSTSCRGCGILQALTIDRHHFPLILRG
jgi:hypothetical protein